MDIEEMDINAGNWVDLAQDRIIGQNLLVWPRHRWEANQ